MEKRAIPRIGRSLSVIGLGTWQLGAGWGEVGEEDAIAVLEAAVAAGVTFIDTADVYGDGRSERLIGRFLRASGVWPPDLLVATKMGRRAPQVPESYTLGAFRRWTDRSRENLGTDMLDLVQLHCPPTGVLASEAVYDALDTLVEDERVAAYGVSVETCEQALTAITRPNVASVQIILNPFRRKPLERVLPAAREAGVGVIARVPLASGLLSGRFHRGSVFAPDDHRTFNRDGGAFDVGETFSGVDYETGVEAAAEFGALAPEGATPAQTALRWIAQQPGVTSVIPGARTAEQARSNAAAADMGALGEAETEAVRELYDRRIRDQVHHRW
ncbi:aldo/keto reductase [Nocardiopsis baichengensis]|uniref:aldo/keto reductase n=1 Tax=Nocardiopsis baichengensis TaxID=280240 RepID=UPI00034537F7|nr:aldo/keto reductase [Nocardiopsis baichengensis]